MQNFPQEVNEAFPKMKFYSLSSIITLILLPPFCFLSIPAVIFSKEAKTLYLSGNIQLAKTFSQKAKRFTIAAWATLGTLLIAISAIAFISYLALI